QGRTCLRQPLDARRGVAAAEANGTGAGWVAPGHPGPCGPLQATTPTPTATVAAPLQRCRALRPTRARCRRCIVAPLPATGPTPRATVAAPVPRCNARRAEVLPGSTAVGATARRG